MLRDSEKNKAVSVNNGHHLKKYAREDNVWSSLITDFFPITVIILIIYLILNGFPQDSDGVKIIYYDVQQRS